MLVQLTSLYCSKYDYTKSTQIMSFQSQDIDGILGGLLKTLSVSKNERSRRGHGQIPGTNQPIRMERALSLLPKRKLKVSDIVNDELKIWQEKANLQASRPPERIDLISRDKIMDTLKSTWNYVHEIEQEISKHGPGSRTTSVLIDRPQIFSSQKLENLTSSTFHPLNPSERYISISLLVSISEMMIHKTHKASP